MMNNALPLIYLVRHGETAWSLTGQHTGRADIPLTERGEAEASKLVTLLHAQTFERVIASPLQRAARTCEIAGYKNVAVTDSNLVEWDYGRFEGRRLAEIRAEHSDWDLFRDGCPGGESPDEVGQRADAVIERLGDIQGNVLLFSSGHLLRVLAARWLGLSPSGGRAFLLNTASLSLLGFEHDRSRKVIRLWNDTNHLRQ